MGCCGSNYIPPSCEFGKEFVDMDEIVEKHIQMNPGLIDEYEKAKKRGILKFYKEESNHKPENRNFVKWSERKRVEGYPYSVWYQGEVDEDDKFDGFGCLVHSNAHIEFGNYKQGKLQGKSTILIAMQGTYITKFDDEGKRQEEIFLQCYDKGNVLNIYDEEGKDVIEKWTIKAKEPYERIEKVDLDKEKEKENP